MSEVKIGDKVWITSEQCEGEVVKFVITGKASLESDTTWIYQKEGRKGLLKFSVKLAFS